MEPNKEGFSYTYSAGERDEVKRIRDKYLPDSEGEDKLTRLRRLDANVPRKGTVWAITVGTTGTLILGGGMSMALVGAGVWFIPGILIGLLGIVLIASAYPLYIAITKRERERLAPEILRLTEELMK
jgi:hypothetical protein